MAAGILALAIVLAMGSLMSIAATTAQSEDRAAAAAATSSVIEQVRAMPFGQLRDFTPPVAEGRMAVEAAVLTANGGAVALPATEDAPAAAFRAPVQLRVRITWFDRGGRPHTMDTVTVLGGQ